MKAFHTFCTKTQGDNPKINPEDLITMIMSVKYYQKTNGDVKLYTDNKGKEMLADHNVLELWNRGIDTQTIENMPEDFNHKTFWAGSKIYALKQEPLSSLMIDNDFIIWKDLSKFNLKEEHDLVVAHDETLDSPCYPKIKNINFSKDYNIDSEWNKKANPLNTAFLLINNEELKKYYTEKSIECMVKNKNIEKENNEILMVFSEQRLLAMAADYKNIKYQELVSGIHDDALIDLKDQNFVTHIWGYKYHLRHNMAAKNHFCKVSTKRLLKDFPNLKETIVNNDLLKKFVNEE